MPQLCQGIKAIGRMGQSEPWRSAISTPLYHWRPRICVKSLFYSCSFRFAFYLIYRLTVSFRLGDAGMNAMRALTIALP
jgi:hypothetical protein